MKTHVFALIFLLLLGARSQEPGGLNGHRWSANDREFPEDHVAVTLDAYSTEGKTMESSFSMASHNNFGKRLVLGDLDRRTRGAFFPGSGNAPRRLLLQSSEKLRLLVPRDNRFPQLLEIRRDPRSNYVSATGFCIDVFENAIRTLPYAVYYEFVAPPNMTYDDLLIAVSHQKYDGVVGDVTILANRSEYVDFTPFTELSLGVVARRHSRGMWAFVKPFTLDLWLLIGLFFVLVPFLVWLTEDDVIAGLRNASTGEQIRMILWFCFLTVVCANIKKLRGWYSKFVVGLWFGAAVVLIASYQGQLPNVRWGQQKLKPNEINHIGYHDGSFVPEILKNRGFEGAEFHSLHTADDFANMLSNTREHGGVSVVVAEMPYIKAFLEKYPEDYIMVTMTKPLPQSNGLGFAFPKGSRLARDLSREIAKLRENGKLQRMENGWFPNQLPYSISTDCSEAVSLAFFGGLFAIVGTGFALILLTFGICKLRENWRAVRDSLSGQVESLKNSIEEAMRPIQGILVSLF